MSKVAYSPVVRTFPLLVVLVLSLVGCGQTDNTVTFSYTLPIAPITFSLDSNGNISVSAAARVVTELGEFAVSASSTASAMSVPTDSLMLTIRHKENGNLVDTVYQINTGVVGSADIQGNISEVKIAWNGQNNTVFVNASNGDITTIIIQGNASSTTSNGDTGQQNSPTQTGSLTWSQLEADIQLSPPTSERNIYVGAYKVGDDGTGPYHAVCADGVFFELTATNGQEWVIDCASGNPSVPDFVGATIWTPSSGKQWCTLVHEHNAQYPNGGTRYIGPGC